MLTRILEAGLPNTVMKNGFLNGVGQRSFALQACTWIDPGNGNLTNDTAFA